MGRRTAATWGAPAVIAIAVLAAAGTARAATILPTVTVPTVTVPTVTVPTVPTVTVPPVTVPTIPAVTVQADALPRLVDEPTVAVRPQSAAPGPVATPEEPTGTSSTPVPGADAGRSVTPGSRSAPGGGAAPQPVSSAVAPPSLTGALGRAAGSFAVPLGMLALLAAYAVASVVRDRRDTAFVQAGAVEQWLPFR